MIPGKQTTDMNEKIVAIVCITVMFLYAIYKVFEWYNPHIDEIHEDSDLMKGPAQIGKCYTIKRTYKNGTITYIRKTMRN